MLVPFLILLVLDHFAKNVLSEMMWGTIDGFNGNDVNSNLTKLDGILSWEGLVKLATSLVGKIWYLLVATLSLGFWGVVYLIRQVYRDYKESKLTTNGLFSIFCLLCICGTLSVATIAMISANNRLDILIYGRYSDMLVGILIVLGLVYLKTDYNWRKNLLFLFYIFITIVAAIVIYYHNLPLEDTFINPVCVPGIFFSKKFDVYQITVSAVGIAVFIYILFIQTKKYFGYHIAFETLVIIVCTTVFSLVAYNGYCIYIQPNQNEEYSNITAYSCLNNHKDYDIYYVKSDKEVEASRLRMQVIDSTIYYRMPPRIEDDYFVVIDDRDKFNLLTYDSLYLVNYFGSYYVFAKGESLTELLRKEGYWLYEMKNIEILTYDDVDIDCPEKNMIVQSGIPFEINVEFHVDKDVFLINENKYCLSYHIYDAQNNLIKWDGNRTPFISVSDTQNISMKLEDESLLEPGEYVVLIDLVEEGVTWLSSYGLEMEKISLTVLE